MTHGADAVKSIYYALGANVSIAVAKFIAAVFTGSGSMLAESVHSVADSTNQLLLLFGLKQAKRPPSPEYPLGFGKAIYFWSFLVALILFSLGGLYSIYEGIHKIRHPEPLSFPLMAIGVLIFGIIAEGVSMRACLREVNKVRGGRSLKKWFQETRQSELIVIFGEDLGALIGLSFALVAITVSAITGNPLFDAIGSIFIGGLLVIIALMIGMEVQALLIGQSVEPKERAAMLEFLNRRREIHRVFSLLTMQLGGDVMVSIKARMVETGSDKALIAAVNRCEAAFKQTFPQVLWLFFEPDLED